jgi:hypothetical protein
VEAELTWLRAEVERLTALTTKQGAHVKLLMTERDTAKREQALVQHAQRRR